MTDKITSICLSSLNIFRLDDNECDHHPKFQIDSLHSWQSDFALTLTYLPLLDYIS